MMTSSRLLVPIIICLLSPILSSCESTTSDSTVSGNRSQIMLISSAELNQVAAQQYATLVSEAASKSVLNTDASMLRRVKGIANHLIPVTKVFRADATGWQWDVNLINSDQRNAFCLPGGKIMVYSGLITQLKLSDDEIAVVLGHEIAHALREHSREQLSQAMAAQAAIDAGSALLGLEQGYSDMASAGYKALIATRFSRTDESEADSIGLELTARAGHDPRAGLTLWQKMIEANQGNNPPEFLSTHPSEANRINHINSLIPQVMPLYQATL